jgi:hypothetical protein
MFWILRAKNIPNMELIGVASHSLTRDADADADADADVFDLDHPMHTFPGEPQWHLFLHPSPV